MKPIPLHRVRYFNGEDTRLLSKHLFKDAAFKVGNRFVNRLKDKINETAEEPVIIAITQIEDVGELQTLLSLTNRNGGPTGEGVSITLETQSDPGWDHAQYTDPR